MNLHWIKTHVWQTIALVIVIILAAPLYFGAQHLWQRYLLSRYHIQTTQTTFPINHWTTPEGATVVFVPLTELPILDVVLMFPAGSAYDGEQFGVAQLTSQLIGEGTQHLDSQTIHEAFESVGANFSANVSRDSASISVRTLTDASLQQKAMDTLATVLKETVFKPEDVEREKARLMAMNDNRAQSPSTVSSDTLMQMMYGTHPYAHPVSGVNGIIANFKPEMLDAFYHQHYNQANAVVTITGDISLREATLLADKLLAQLPAKGSPRGIPAVELTVGQHKHIDFPATQTSIFWGMPMMAKGNPDYFAFSVGNYLLGGPMTSQLFDVVREKAGLAYSVGSGISPLEQLGPFTVSLQTRNKEAQQGLQLAESTVNNFLKNPIDPAALQSAKEYLKGNFSLALASNADISDFVSMLAFYHLPWDYSTQYAHHIDTVTAADIQKVFNAYIKTMDFSLVTVGGKADDPDQDSADLRTLPGPTIQ